MSKTERRPETKQQQTKQRNIARIIDESTVFFSSHIQVSLGSFADRTNLVALP